MIRAEEINALSERHARVIQRADWLASQSMATQMTHARAIFEDARALLVDTKDLLDRAAEEAARDG